MPYSPEPHLSGEEAISLPVNPFNHYNTEFVKLDASNWREDLPTNLQTIDHDRPAIFNPLVSESESVSHDSNSEPQGDSINVACHINNNLTFYNANSNLLTQSPIPL